MTTPGHGLFFLIADIARKEALRDRFQRDPAGVFQEYGVSTAEIATLRSRDPAKIRALLGEEGIRILESLVPIVMIPWPGQHVSVASSAPSEGPIGAAIPFTVTGMFFIGSTSLTFTRPGLTVTAQGVVAHCRADGNSWLKGTATFAVPGDYDVNVTVTVGRESQTSTLPRGFTATKVQ